MFSTDPAIKFYRAQWRRYLLPCVLILVADASLLFYPTTLPLRTPLVAILSGMLGGFVRFLEAERVPVQSLHDTANMFRYWTSLLVGAILGFFAYLLLLDGRLLKAIYPTAKVELSGEPSDISIAILAGLAGLFARDAVARIRSTLGKQMGDENKPRPD